MVKLFTKLAILIAMLATGFSAHAIEEWCISGDFNSWGDTKMTHHGNGVFMLELERLTPEFKFKLLGSWEKSLGDTDEKPLEVGQPYTMTENGGTITFPVGVTAIKGAFITLNVPAKTVLIDGTFETSVNDSEMYVVGDLNEWSIGSTKYVLRREPSTEIFTGTVSLPAPASHPEYSEWRLYRSLGAWGVGSYGLKSESTQLRQEGTLVKDSQYNVRTAPGDYEMTYNNATGTFSMLRLDAPDTQTVTAIPLPGGKYNFLSEFQLTFEGFKNVIYDMALGAPDGAITLKNEKGEVMARGFGQPLPIVTPTLNVILSKTVYNERTYEDADEEEKEFYTPVPDGKYLLEIPAGCLTLYAGDGTQIKNEAILLEYFIGSDPISTAKLNIDPAPGVVTQIREAVITFDPEPQTLEISNNNLYAIELLDVSGLPAGIRKFNVSIEGKTARISLDEPFSTPGYYAIDVPPNFFKINGEENQATRFKRYEIEASTVTEKSISTTPADGSTVKVLNMVDVIYEGYYSVEANSALMDFDTSTAFFADDKGAKIAASVTLIPYNAVGLRVIPRSIIAEEGEWTLTIPAGAITLYEAAGEKTANAEPLVWKWNVKPLKLSDYSLVANPTPGEVSRIKDIKINVSPVPEVLEVNTDKAVNLLFKATPEAEWQQTARFTLSYNEDDKTLTLSTAQLTEKGYYQVVIPEGTFKYNGATAPAYEIAYTIGVNGIGDILGEDSRADVYTPDGILIIRNADSEAIRNLQGLYIIGGRKVIVR